MADPSGNGANGNGDRVAMAVNTALLTMAARIASAVGVPLLVLGLVWAGGQMVGLSGDLRELKLTLVQTKDLLGKDMELLRSRDIDHERRIGNIETYVFPKPR